MFDPYFGNVLVHSADGYHFSGRGTDALHRCEEYKVVLWCS